MNTLLQQLFLGREALTLHIIVHPQPDSHQLWQEQGFIHSL